MNTRDRAVSHAAAFRSHLLAAEEQVRDALAVAETEGLDGVAGALRVLRNRLLAAHKAAETVARAAAHWSGDEVTVYSGPEDKPDPDEGQP